MAGARVLADGKTKWTVLTTAPANPAAPTATELNAGIDMSCDILKSDFNWTATDSESIAEDALCDKDTQEVFGKGNYNLGVTIWRKYATAGGPDEASEAGWAVMKEKGAEFYAYARESDKDSTETWTAGDEIYLGGKVSADQPQRLDGTGFIKRRVPLKSRGMFNNIEVAAGA